MKRVIVCLLVLSLGLLLKSCNSVEPPPPPDEDKIENTITLTTQWQDLKKISVNFTRSQLDTSGTFTYKLKRKNPTGNETEFLFMLLGMDTTFIDENLTKGTYYSYKVEAEDQQDKTKDTSRTLLVTTLDTTSHNITWQIDTLGQPGDYLNDAWGLDENNVWAVGAVTISGERSGIIKWNGQSWETFPSFAASKQAIWGFDKQNIFVVGDFSNRGKVGHWNGSTWTEYDYNYFYAKGDTVWGLTGVWGSTSDDVWAVGLLGTIIHWDGVEWKKIQSPAKIAFQDIWGIDANNIYAVTASSTEDSKIYRYDGQSWNYFDKPLPPGGRLLTSLWFDKNGTGYAGGNDFYYYNGSDFRQQEINLTSLIKSIRGRNSTDVWVVGQRLRVYHFNGESWTDFPELFGDNFQSLEGVWAFANTVFCVGELSGIGSISIIGRR